MPDTGNMHSHAWNEIHDLRVEYDSEANEMVYRFGSCSHNTLTEMLSVMIAACQIEGAPEGDFLCRFFEIVNEAIKAIPVEQTITQQEMEQARTEYLAFPPN